MTLPESRRLDFTEIPILDIGPLLAGNHDTSLIDDLYRACADVGFLYVTNHGVPLTLIESLRHSAQAFFSSPMPGKMKIVIDARIRGYYPPNRSYSAGNLIEGEDRAGTSHKEGFWIGHERPVCNDALLHGPNQWPVDYPDLRQSMMKYFHAVEELAGVLLRGFALALKLDEQCFDSLFLKPMTSLLLNHYPPQDNPTTHNDIGLVPHADAGGFTILWQDDSGGLEIQNKKGEWVVAPPMEGTFVINIGNVMQTWTNGRFSSTPHRVINRSNRDRYSIPLFVNPSYDVTVKPLVDIDHKHSGAFNYGAYQRDVWRQTFPIAEIPS
jgi:isopenicillin N synthase-like dioxygenase